MGTILQVQPVAVRAYKFWKELRAELKEGRKLASLRTAYAAKIFLPRFSAEKPHFLRANCILAYAAAYACPLKGKESKNE